MIILKLDLLYKILLSDKPSKLIKENEKYFFEIIPEFEKSKGFNQNNPWHVYDVYEHILHVVDGVDNNITLRMVALFHDMGKPFVYFEDENGVGHFPKHWIKSNEIFLRFANKYNLDKDFTQKVSLLIIYHDLRIDLNDKEMIKIIKSLGKENIELLYKIKKADLKAQSSNYHYLLNKYDEEQQTLKNNFLI